MFILILIRKIPNYLKNSPVSSKDIVLWCCLFISLIPAVYTFYLLSLYNVLLLLLQVLIVFIVVFVLIECYDHPTRTWNVNHWLKKPLSVNVFRCIAAVPIYNGTFGVWVWWLEFVFFRCAVESSVISLLLAFPFAYVILKSVWKFAVLKTIPTRGQLIACAFGYYWLLNAKVMLVDISPTRLSYTKFVNGQFKLVNCVNGKQPNTDQDTSNTIWKRAWDLFGARKRHEAPRQKWDDKLEEIHSGAHQQHAQRGGDSVVNANWEALGYKASHDCLRVVCKVSQAIIQNIKEQSEKPPESPSSSEFNPFK